MSARELLTLVRLTPPGRGAVATLLVEGPGALAAVASVFRPKSGRALDAEAFDRPVFGHFGSPDGEEVVVRCRSAESVELHCHGGHAAIERLEQTLIAQGGRPVSWQGWAVIHHEDPIVAAARIALAEARTQRTALILLDQFNGALSEAVRAMGESLHGGDAPKAGQQLDALLAHAPLGRHLTEPWRVVLAGAPNVGKSSLINALVGYQRAIVHHVPGTTRDVVTATTAIEGWPVELSDTAGLRETSHPIEQAGMELAQDRMGDADLVLLVFDSSQSWTDADRALCAAWPGAILVYNKADLGREKKREKGGRHVLCNDHASMAPASGPFRQKASVPFSPLDSCDHGLATVAVTGEGIEPLLRAIASRLMPDPPAAGEAVPFTPGQIDLLAQTRDALVKNDVKAAIKSLERLTK